MHTAFGVLFEPCFHCIIIISVFLRNIYKLANSGFQLLKFVKSDILYQFPREIIKQ